jgi:putative transposase
LARPLRIEFPGAIYHVMSHGVAGTQTCMDELDRSHFLDDLRELVETGKLLIHAFILMINHFHLLCETPASGLSRHMQQLLGKYTQWFNRRHNRHGHLWQARYKALLVEGGKYFLHCSRYIHLNSVRAKICAAPEEYQWSSYGCYLNRSEYSRWITTSKILDCFSSRSDYARFVLQGLKEEVANPFESAVAGTVFGSRTFVNQLGSLVQLSKVNKEIPAMHELKLSLGPSIASIIAAIDLLFTGLSQCQRTRMLIYAMRRFTEKTGREIALITGRSPSDVSHAWHTTQMQLLNDPELQRKMETVAQLLGREMPCHQEPKL